MAGGHGQAGRQPVKKNKALLAAGSVMVLAAVVAAVAVGVSKRDDVRGWDDEPSSARTTSKSVQAICAPTDYKVECESSLSVAAPNETDPKKLIELTFGLAINNLRAGLERSVTLQAASEDPRTKDALDCCKELLDDSIAELDESVSKLSEFEMARMGDVIDDLKVWVSAALTNQRTCLDGFEDTTGDAAAGMAKALNSSITLTSNTLAIIDGLGSVLDSLSLPSSTRRQLHSPGDGEFPEWIDRSRRKLLDGSPKEIAPDLTVAKDGSGNFTTIMAAVNAVPLKKNVTFVIYVKAGVYAEKVEIPRNTWNLMMIGDGPNETIVTGSLSKYDGVATFHTASFAVRGDQFWMKNMGVRNTAGPEKHQAVALRVQSDRSVFYKCEFDGYQDTLYAHSKRQFYRECTVTGTIDFIFGDSATVLQNCMILVRKPMANQRNIVTAQGRDERREPTGIVIQNCTITADKSLEPVKALFQTYLGRPWKQFSRTIVMQSEIDDLINPDGWLPWTGDFGLATCFYAEVEDRGPGANKTKRVTWGGIKQLTSADAQQFTTKDFLQGDTWLPETGVPFTSGLM